MGEKGCISRTFFPFFALWFLTPLVRALRNIDRAGVHNAQEFENRFWTVFALMLSTTALFATDSPVALGLWSPR